MRALLSEEQTARGVDHGRESRKFNQGCTICRPSAYRSAVSESREYRHGMAGSQAPCAGVCGSRQL